MPIIEQQKVCVPWHRATSVTLDVIDISNKPNYQIEIKDRNKKSAQDSRNQAAWVCGQPEVFHLTQAVYPHYQNGNGGEEQQKPNVKMNEYKEQKQGGRLANQ